jgi:hypothetical protein
LEKPLLPWHFLLIPFDFREIILNIVFVSYSFNDHQSTFLSNCYVWVSWSAHIHDHFYILWAPEEEGLHCDWIPMKCSLVRQ